MGKYKVGSLFSGIGGICSAFEQADFKVKWSNEFDKKACETYKKNFKGVNLIEGDICKIEHPEDLSNVDVVTSGFPCQAFSIAGYRKGFDDERGNLFFETARFIEHLKPKAFLLENVRNLIAHDKGRTFKIIEEVIRKELNYSFIPFVLDSKEYGNIPQTRSRIYIVGFRGEGNYYHKGQPNLFDPSITHTCTSQFDTPTSIPLLKTIQDMLHTTKQEERYYYREGHRYFDKLNEAMKSMRTVYQWRRVYVRENKSNLCPTLTANMGTGGHNVPLVLVKDGIRKLTPKECLRFQGFPEDFEFPTNMANSHCYKQAGNSVVVPVVKRIADEIRRVLVWKYGNYET